MKPTGRRIGAYLKARLVLPLLFLGVVGTAPMVMAQSTGTFTPTGSMTTARRGHTATLLADGRVLIAGGWGVPENQGNSLASAEVYDPSTGKFMATGNMTATRRYHTATLLPDGRVLVAGGTYSGNSALASAELYDPSTGTFSPTGDMITARSGQMASLLPNGKVLIAAGLNGSGCNPCPYFLVSAELYDPATGTFSTTGDMTRPSYEQNVSILLPDGRVFIGGGPTSELYDPGTGTFGRTGGWNAISGWPDTQTLLTNGKVLVAGGDPEAYGAEVGAGVYDPGAGAFTPTGNMNTARDFHTATLLPDGTVLIAGGQVNGGGTLTSAELYDPSTGTFSATGGMIFPRCCHTATLLNDGQVLIAGGAGLSSPELYKPTLLIPAPALFSVSGDGQGQGAILHSSTHQVASPDNPAAIGEALEIYCTGLADGSVIPPQVSIGGRMAEILFFGKAPGFAGLNQVNVRLPGGVAPGPAVPVRLSYMGRTSNEVTIGVR
jgi:galactose oxidase-like protein/Kelch motif protein